MDTIICDELLQEIFHRLPPPSSSAVSLTSKRWLHLFRSSLSSLSLHLSTNHHHSLSTFLSHHTYLSSLTVTTTTTTTTTTSFSDHLLTTISSTCPNLTRLHLSTGPVSFPPLLSLSTKLTSLSIIISRHHFTLAFLPHFKHLTHLSLTIIGNSDIHVPELPPLQSQLLRLNSLSLSGIRAGDYPLSFLWSNTCHQTLTKLVFHNCQGVGDIYSFSSFFKRLETLNELELKTCRSIMSLVLIKLAENGCRGSLSSLLIYDGGCKESLLHFIREMPISSNLTKIDFRLPLDLYDDHLLEIGVKFKRLRVLRLQSCSSMVTGDGIKSLGLALSDCLEELGLTNCDDVINRQTGFLVDLAQNLKRIKILDLSYNHMLMDKEFVSMISSYADLRILNLRGCSRLSDVSLLSLSRNCKRLESVDMAYCHGVRVEGVEFLILNCSELRKVQVEDWKVSQVARTWMMMNNFIIEVQP